MRRSRLLFAVGAVALVGGVVLLGFNLVQGGTLSSWGGAVGGLGGAIAALEVGRAYARIESETDRPS